MSASAARSAVADPLRALGEALRVAFLGAPVWLEGCAPTQAVHDLTPSRFTIDGTVDLERTIDAVAGFRPHVTVIFDPAFMPGEARRHAPGVTLGVLVNGLPEPAVARSLEGIDRLVSFLPALTGAPVGRSEIWRAIPPPVSDMLFGDVRSLRRAPRAMSIGRSSAHREAMLMPAKHHHDLLQVIHGVSGEPLHELLSECDVGVFVAAEPGGGFGAQVGMHLAAGHLLLAEELAPAHGLERNIDYLQVDSPDGLVWVLDRMTRFPEMYQRLRCRGRMKAKQYRASRLFRRLAHDLLLDVRAFGSARSS
jgi:hypothetical protein